MNALQVIGALAITLLHGSNDKLTLKAVKAWISDYSNRDVYGAGYVGNNLSRGPSNGFVEIVRHAASSGKFTVTATVYFDPRQGAAASKTWTSRRLDADLAKFFGKNLRVRVDV